MGELCGSFLSGVAGALFVGIGGSLFCGVTGRAAWCLWVFLWERYFVWGGCSGWWCLVVRSVARWGFVVWAGKGVGRGIMLVGQMLKPFYVQKVWVWGICGEVFEGEFVLGTGGWWLEGVGFSLGGMVCFV